MKRFTALILILLCFTSPRAAESAFEAGSKSVSGNFLFASYGGDAYADVTVLDFNPQYTVCLNNGFFFGMIGQIRSSSYNSNSNTQWTMGFVGEWYQASRYSSSRPMVPYFRAAYLYGRNSQTNLHSFGVQVGALQMITSSTGIDFGIQGSLDFYSRRNSSSSGFILQGTVGFTSFIF